MTDIAAHREWCERMARLEGDAEIGAGVTPAWMTPATLAAASDGAYSPAEYRVAQWLVANTGIGAGPDPVGFVIASHEALAAERNAYKAALMVIAGGQGGHAVIARKALDEAAL